MTLALSKPFWFGAKPKQPVFKSVRTTRAPIAEAPVEVASVQEPEFETAAEDTWYDKKSGFEVLLDLFWARRNVSGSMRSRRQYRQALRWQAIATLPLFPPIGALLVLFNICFGLRPKATRLAFIASCALAALVVSNAMFATDPLTLASLR